MGEGARVTVASALPLLAAAVRQGLLAAGRTELADQIEALPLLERCAVVTISAARFIPAEPSRRTGLILTVADGMLIIHTTEDNQIVEIEAYDVFKRELDAALPLRKRRGRPVEKST